MKNEERVERLAHILEEHECWSDGSWTKEDHALGHAARIRAAIECPWEGHAWSALRTAIREVESGAIFGSTKRCCVCGSDTESGLPRRVRFYRMFQSEHAFFAHRGCYLLIEAAADQLQNSEPWSREKEIIRARRLHREKAKRPCDHSWKLVESRKAVSLWRCEKCEEAWIRPRRPRVSETWGMREPFFAWDGHGNDLTKWRIRLACTNVKAVVPAGCAQPWPKPPQPSEEMVERVKERIAQAITRTPIPMGYEYRHFIDCDQRMQRNIDRAARAAIREVLR